MCSLPEHAAIMPATTSEADVASTSTYGLPVEGGVNRRSGHPS
jgi:hypothetical protein